MRSAPTSTISLRLTSVITLVIQAWLTVSLVLFIVRRNWENVFLTLAVIGLIIVPAFLLKRWRVLVPAEFQVIATLFAFLSLFLGSASGYYDRFWWWDIVLHTSSGFLFGIVGWIVMFLLLQTDRLPRTIGPALMCAFGVTFAVSLGVVWEIIEYVIDLIWHVNMMSHETGVNDTMQDLIVDFIGALIVGGLGYAHARRGRFSFLVDAARAFMHRNPRFRRRRRAAA